MRRQTDMGTCETVKDTAPVQNLPRAWHSPTGETRWYTPLVIVKTNDANPVFSRKCFLETHVHTPCNISVLKALYVLR